MPQLVLSMNTSHIGKNERDGIERATNHNTRYNKNNSAILKYIYQAQYLCHVPLTCDRKAGGEWMYGGGHCINCQTKAAFFLPHSRSRECPSFFFYSMSKCHRSRIFKESDHDSWYFHSSGGATEELAVSSNGIFWLPIAERHYFSLCPSLWVERLTEFRVIIITFECKHLTDWLTDFGASLSVSARVLTPPLRCFWVRKLSRNWQESASLFKSVNLRISTFTFVVGGLLDSIWKSNKSDWRVLKFQNHGDQLPFLSPSPSLLLIVNDPILSEFL